MRITGGTLARRNIKVPNKDVRPTTDMVREAIFSMRATRLPDAKVLDLFAGSGVIGLEACSRGAKKVYGVESERHVLKTLRANIAAMKVDNYQVVASDVVSALNKALASNKFDVIFADPPYWWEQEQVEQRSGENRRGNDGEIPRLIKDSGCLAEGGLLIVERAAKDRPTECDGWELIDHRVYGGTGLSFYKQSNQ